MKASVPLPTKHGVTQQRSEPGTWQRSSQLPRLSRGPHLSHCLQKLTLSCLGMPSVMSTRARRHPTHMLAGLGGMGTPQWQQRLWDREQNRVNDSSPRRGHPEPGFSTHMLPCVGAAGAARYSMGSGERGGRQREHAAWERHGAGREAVPGSGRERKGRRAGGMAAVPPPEGAVEPPPCVCVNEFSSGKRMAASWSGGGS